MKIWEIIVEGEDLLARCLLHEIDHLDGVMYVDKVEGKLLILKRRMRNSEGYIYGDS